MTASGGGRIYHLVSAARWEQERGGPRIDVAQFERHGFVHCCFREQIVEIASWWFDPADPSVAIELDPARITAEVRNEPSPTRWYPHVYGPLDASAVIAAHAVPRDAHGAASLPAALASPPPAYRLVARRGGAHAVVRWQDGTLTGDAAWIDDAARAIAEARPVELIGGVVVPATLATPYESFSLLVELSDALVRYDGDGFAED